MIKSGTTSNFFLGMIKGFLVRPELIQKQRLTLWQAKDYYTYAILAHKHIVPNGRLCEIDAKVMLQIHNQMLKVLSHQNSIDQSKLGAAFCEMWQLSWFNSKQRYTKKL